MILPHIIGKVLYVCVYRLITIIRSQSDIKRPVTIHFKVLPRKHENVLLVDRKAVLRHLMCNEAGKKLASVVFGSMVHQELKNLCSNHFDSILREKSPTAMEYFSWNSIWLELEAKAPMLTTALKKSMKSFSKGFLLFVYRCFYSVKTKICVWYKQ